MLSFDLRSLDRQAVVVDGELGPDDAVWEPDDPRPTDSVRVSGRLSSAGPGRYYFAGRIGASAETDCRRCLEPVRVEAADEVQLLFAEAGDAETGDDPDVYTIDPRATELDLRPAVREQWLLVAPRFALCREDCRGLCATCGTNLNEGSCDCASPGDSRWDALRAARTDRA